ncbi:SPXN protein, partial [Panurus biarmicus]|nr:SPXN protein [Panurus biarmicus]
AQGLHKLTASALALFLAGSFISFSWSAPQSLRDYEVGITTNWGGCFHPSPTAFVEGRRFIADESQRKDLFDRVHLETRSQNTNPLSFPEAAALFLTSLQKAQE